MRFTPSDLLQNDTVKAALRSAWRESLPGITGGHEEGGFILQSSDGDIIILRWPVGIQNQISVPLHNDCRIDGDDILASFHTHPNTGNNFLQEPSTTDRRAVRDDPNLKGALYLGEYVIATEMIYLIQSDGEVIEMISRHELFEEG